MTPLATTAVRAAALTLILWLVAQAGANALLCPPHLAWLRVQAEPSAIVLEQGERVARPGDAIFVCERTHRSGVIAWHKDLDCYCAPAAMTAADLGRRMNGSCVIDKIAPLRSDDWGACRYARCSRGVD